MINKQTQHSKLSPQRFYVLGNQSQINNYSNMSMQQANLRLKMNQTQNKSKFFEGQLDALINSNMQMKYQLSQAQRMLLNSTEMLRNLLPQPSLPQRKLALQLANIEGVSQLIKQDWHNMENNIKNMQAHLEQKVSKIRQLQLQNITLIKSHRQQIQSLLQSHHKQVTNLQQIYHNKQQQLQQQVDLLNTKLKQLVNLSQSKTEKMKLMQSKYQAVIKQQANTISQQERTIQRLQDEQSQQALQFQASKKLLVEHYLSQFAQKQQDIKNSYELLLKMKNEQHEKSIQQITSYVNDINIKMQSHQKRISQLNQLVLQKQVQQKQLEAQWRRVQDQLVKRNAVIEGLNAELQIKLKTIKQLQNDNLLKLTQIEAIKQQNKLTQEQLAAALTKYAEREQNIALLISKREQEIAEQIAKRQKQLQLQQIRCAKYLQQKNKKQYQIRQLQEQVKNVLKEVQQFKTLQQQYTKLNNLIEDYKLKQAKHKTEVEDYQTLISSKIQELNRAQILHDEAIKKLDQKHNLHIKNMEKQTLRKLKQVEQSQSEYIMKLMKEQSQRLGKQQAEIASLQQTHKSQIYNLQQKILEMSESTALLQKQLAQRDKNHLSEISMLQQKHADALEQQINDYTAQLNKMQMMLKQQELNFASQLQNKEHEYTRSLSMKQQQFNSKIEGLQKNIIQLKSSSAVSEIQNKYLAMIDRLRGESGRQKQALINKQSMQLKLLRDQLQKQLKQKQRAHLQYVHKQEYEYNIQLKSISQKLSSNIAVLNDELLQQKQAHQFTKMTREEKIIYLTEKILAFRKAEELKNQRILQLQYEIQQKIKEMQAIDELVNEKLRKKKQQYDMYLEQTQKQCQNMVKKKTEQCNLRIKQIQVQRFKFTQRLYLEFQQMKNNFQRQLNSQIKKYDELEKLFQQRPSRQEDVNKIKQLTLIKQKMDIQVKQFKKKIVSANQIVKYLNLQLENYKQVYDIFGPEGFDSEMAQNKQEELESFVRGSMNFLTQSSSSIKRSEKYNEKVLNVRKYVRQRNDRVRTEMSTIQQKIDHNKEQDQSSNIGEDQKNQQDYQTLRQVREHKEQLKQTNLMFKKYKHRRVESLRKMTEDSEKNKKQAYNEQQTTKQLRSNAEIFLSMVNINQKPVAEVRRVNPDYGKMSKRRAFKSFQKQRLSQKQKKYQIRDRILTLQR